MKQLRPYQENAIQELRSALALKLKPVLSAPTGSGKTRIASEIFALARVKNRRVCFCVPFLSLIRQTYRAFVEAGIDEREIGIIQANNELTDWSRPVQIASIDTLSRRPKFPDVDVVIFDEVHNNSVVYKRWMEASPNTYFIGMSATPWASGMSKLWDKMIVVSTVAELIKDGYLSPFKYYAPSVPDLRGVKIVAGDYQKDQLALAMSKADLIADIVTTWIKKGENRPTFCFAVNRRHAQEIQHQFLNAGIPAGYVDAYTPVEEREAMINQLRDGELKVICNIGTMTTGVDAPFVSCIILARPTKSEMLYCLDSNTEILTSHGWKGIGQVKEGDCAATLSDIDSGKGKWSRINAVIERNMSPEERWVEYDAPRANFRVTDNHTMIYATGKPGNRKYKKDTAYNMANEKGSVFMRTAVEIDQTGVPLTDAELYFVGMMMSDGSWTNISGNISQSERHPKIIERIENCLRDCGIGYAKKKVKVNNGDDDSGFIQRYNRWVFHFSSGKPHASNKLGIDMAGNKCKHQYDRVNGITGFRHLIPYMDKDFSPALMAMSKSQLIKFIEGLWDGDGTKKINVDYTPRSWEICSARKVMIDRLQALCAINGFTANSRLEVTGRTNPIWVITITPKDWRSCGGYSHKDRDSRPQINVKNATNEKVWCVETEEGTIITRRFGKVTVMGNCQIIGRGLRTNPDKQDCIILDHSSTALNLGRPDEIFYDHFRGGQSPVGGTKADKKEKEDPKPRACPSCGFLLLPKEKDCPSCGYVFPPPSSDVYVADGELAELGSGGKLRKVKFDEKQSFWSGLLYLAEERGRARSWALANYKNKFGVWPRNLKDKPEYPTKSVRDFVKSRNIAWARRMEKERISTG